MTMHLHLSKSCESFQVPYSYCKASSSKFQRLEVFLWVRSDQGSLYCLWENSLGWSWHLSL